MQAPDDDSNEEASEERYLLKIETNEGFVFKPLVEVFHCALLYVVFRVSAKGLQCRNDNSKSAAKNQEKTDATLLIDLDMPRKGFSKFIIPKGLEEDEEAVLYLPVEASIMRNATSGILKADNLCMYVKESDINTLTIRVFNSAKGRDGETSIKLLPLESLSDSILNPLLPVDYDLNKPVACGTASEFSKSFVGSAKSKATIVNAIAQADGIQFISSNGEFSKKFAVGTFDLKKKEIYNKNFIFNQGLNAAVKACPMSKNVRIYASGNRPLMISLDSGSNGFLNIYLVPK